MNRGDLQQPVDVVIVGAGAAGGVFAATLARAGKSIHILEAGPPWTRDDLVPGVAPPAAGDRRGRLGAGLSRQEASSKPR